MKEFSLVFLLAADEMDSKSDRNNKVEKRNKKLANKEWNACHSILMTCFVLVTNDGQCKFLFFVHFGRN